MSIFSCFNCFRSPDQENLPEYKNVDGQNHLSGKEARTNQVGAASLKMRQPTASQQKGIENRRRALEEYNPVFGSDFWPGGVPLPGSGLS
jgi:hypothetical protein